MSQHWRPHGPTYRCVLWEATILSHKLSLYKVKVYWGSIYFCWIPIFIDFVVCRLFYFFEVPALCLEKMIQFRKKSDFIMFMNITILFDLGERYSLCFIMEFKKYRNPFLISIEENKNLWFCIKFPLPYWRWFERKLICLLWWHSGSVLTWNQ